MRSTLASIVLTFALLTDVAAQEQQLYPGRLVRVTRDEADLNRTKVVVVGRHGDALTLRYERFRADAHGRHYRDSVETEVPLSAMTRLEVSSGTRSGAKGGLLVGGASGFFVGLISSATYYSSDEEGAARYILGGAAVGGALGAGIGWLIGSAIKSDRWEELPLERLGVSVAPLPNGVRIGVRIAF